MKKTLIAEIWTIPDNLKQAVVLSKLMLLVALCVAVLGVVIALSSDTENRKAQYFIEKDGYALEGLRVRSAGSAQVRKAYPIESNEAGIRTFSEKKDSVLRDTSMPFTENE